LKGVPTPVPAYEVIDLRQTAGDLRGLGALQTPIVGREGPYR
jgi:hypothetical protein